MKERTILIKPASSLCNMRCKYCFYADVSDHREIKSYGIMKEETAEKVIDSVFRDTEADGKITFAFQGGEPTLAGLDYFRNFVKYAAEASISKHISVEYSIQTNGMCIDDEWCIFLKNNHFLVGLSLDGPADLHNINRIDASGKSTWKTVSNTALKLKKYDVDFNILCVLNRNNARHPEKLWRYFLWNGFRYLQFIPCLPELDQDENGYSLTPEMFCEFYTVIFRLWKQELERGNYISVKLFDDLANMLIYRRITACGINGTCNLQYIIESDGSVYPCDFYVIDEYRLGNLTEDTLLTIEKNYLKSEFHALRKELPMPCSNCGYIKLCYGGCVRLRHAAYIKGNYCGYQNLLKEIGDSLIQTVTRVL